MNKELTTLFTGRQIINLPFTDSTNSYLLEQVKARQVPEGTVVTTNSQQAGRGQMGNRWLSEDGKNLMLSYIFYPTFISPKTLFLLNKAYALGVYDFLRSALGSEVRIKWPNDMYWKSKKLGGLLIENAISSGVVNNSIIGIGINVNQSEFPPALPNPVSMTMIRPSSYSLEDLLKELSNSIEGRYLQLKRGDKDGIDADYHKALFRCEEWSFYEDKKGKFPGCIKGVDNLGKLKVEDEDGELRMYDLKEIRFLGI